MWTKNVYLEGENVFEFCAIKFKLFMASYEQGLIHIETKLPITVTGF